MKAHRRQTGFPAHGAISPSRHAPVLNGAFPSDQARMRRFTTSSTAAPSASREPSRWYSVVPLPPVEGRATLDLVFSMAIVPPVVVAAEALVGAPPSTL